MKLKVIIFFCALFYSLTQQANNNAVSYDLAGGRLGDQIINYLHAKWVSYKYNLPLYCKPFPYSDQLVLHDEEFSYEKLRNVTPVTLSRGQSLDSFINKHSSNTLYVIPYFPESPEEYLPTTGPVGHAPWARPTNIFVHFSVDWNDPVFKKSIQHFVSPKYPLNLIKPPKDKISIAIQVRKNSGGFDLPLLNGLSDAKFNPNQVYVDVVFPLKHPPEDYYLEQLKRVIEMFPQEKFYVFIFTDDPNPPAIMENFKNAMQDDRIEFTCRTTENNHFSNVLEDLFSMTKFDCLIRPDSNLSIVASRLGDFKVVISPIHHHWEGRKLIIDKVDIEKNI